VDATYENFSIENLTVHGWPISGVNAEKEIPQQGQIWCTGKTEVLTFLSDRRISAIQVTR
jgi:hypothetical protein